MNDQVLQITMFGINLLIAAGAGWGSAFLVIGKYKEKVNNLEKDRDKILIKIDGLKSNADRMAEFEVNAQKFIDKKLYDDHSPLALTEYGQALVTESGFVQIFEVVKDDLVSRLETKNPPTQYDVQEMARALMDELTDYTAFESIKTYSFQNGKDYQQILRAGAILLRDYYLEKHPRITQ